MQFTVRQADEIQRAYRRRMAAFPLQKARADAFSARLGAMERLCLQQQLAAADTADLLRYTPADRYPDVRAALETRRQLPWAEAVPTELWCSYVLPSRVGTEQLEAVRPALLAALLPHVAGCKTMLEALLAVNYWCAARGTYTPTDERTIGPAGFLRAGAGRCGEETVFCVNALRTVGIPSRQVYAPRWAHCDDNHAWVEAWADGRWYYLGACEPEPVPDRGWFTAAASRTMVVRAREPGISGAGRSAAGWQTDRLVSVTARYTATADLTVHLTRDGVPVQGHAVELLLASEARLFTVYTGITDAAGLVRVTVGLGTVLVRAKEGDAVVDVLADLDSTRLVRLELADARTPAQLTSAARSLRFVPPAGTGLPPEALPEAMQALHARRMAACDAARAAGQKSWYRGEANDPRTLARGNRAQIEAFLEDTRFDMADKHTLLATLAAKDLCDITAEALADTLINALPHRAALPPEVWRTAVLAPRVALEPLTALPSALARAWQRMHTGDVAAAAAAADAADGSAVWRLLADRLQLLPAAEPDEAVSGRLLPDPVQCLESGLVPADALDYVYAATCRAIGIPARLCPLAGRAQWWRAGLWLDAETAAPLPTAPLQLINGADRPLACGRQFTLALWQTGRWHTLPLKNEKGDALVLEHALTLTLPAGLYQLTAMTRQPDGTADIAQSRFALQAGSEPLALTVTPPPDDTARCIRQVPLTALLPAGILSDAPGLLVWAAPGQEPTTHLLTELAALAASWNAAPYTLTVFTEPAAAGHPTVAALAAQLCRVRVLAAPPQAVRTRLQRAMGVGDVRLPFALAFDRRQNGLAAFAEYSIDSGAALLRILDIAEEKEK